MSTNYPSHFSSPLRLLRSAAVRFFFICLRSVVPKGIRDTITADAKAYFSFREIPFSFGATADYFLDSPEFRSLVYYRLPNRYRYPMKWFFPGMTALFFGDSRIAPGLIIMHGFATIINGKLGPDCMVFQQVTIGFSKNGTPEIGSGTTICCGAKVLGRITLGRNVTVGANAVVTKDVPDFAIVAGAPARIIGYNTGNLRAGRE